MHFVAAGILLCAIVGCQQTNPFVANQAVTANSATAVTAQLDDLRRQVAQLDANNRDLHAQLAQSQQSGKVFQDQITLLQNRLKTTSDQLQQVQVAKEEVQQQVQALQASTRQRGNATITANNSVQRSLNPIQLPGIDVKQDGDVIRINLPADQLFFTGTAQLQNSSSQILDQVAQAVAQNYSRNRIGIEGHIDSGPSYDANASSHLLTAQQAMAVFEQLSRRNRLPANQLFVMGMGANHPRASNATSTGRAANRRVEIVIYPEQF